MNKENIKSLIDKKLNLIKSYVTGDNNHIKIIAISNVFKNVSPVKRQQMIYSHLSHMIQQKTIHAVSIFSYTPEEWTKNKKNMMFDNL